jgi:hypothetical protein
MRVPDWSLCVNDFGPIKRAEIKLAPLVLLVGKNNTGKSYIASMLWAMLNPANALYARPPAHGGSRFKACVRIADAIRSGEKTKVELSDWQAIVAWINETLSDDATEIARRILACDHCRYGKALFTLNHCPDALNVEFRERPKRATRRRTAARPRGISIRRVGATVNITTDEDQAFSADDAFTILRFLARQLLLGPDRLAALYLPAARTGLMLAFKTLMAGLLRSLGREGDDDGRTTLAAPVVDFLEDLGYNLEYPERDQPHFGIAQDIERQVLGGEIAQGENEDLGYTPSGSGVRLPLHAVSSLITEIAPLIVFLKAGVENQTIIFEEPEAHLHLSAQRMLARNLVRLVNSGVQMVITTHSDTLLQQLNILMQLHNHPQREALMAEFGYRPDEIIDPTHASGYLFEDADGGTIVRPMSKTRSGFVEPTMNETIAQLTREAIRLDETDSEEGHG